MNGNGRARTTTPVRTTPIALLDRRRLPQWLSLSPQTSAAVVSPRAQLLLDCLHTHGALFFEELAEASHLLRPQVEEVLGELVALGRVSSDSFAGLRALLVPSSRRQPIAGAKRRGRIVPFAIESGGRWALIRRASPPGGGDAQARDAAVEHVARTLLQRYGVVFWRLLAREAGWLPPWRDLLRVYRRLEARGEIRGGRFVSGFSGEQYALPEAVGLLRETRRQAACEQWISLSGADPLNLIGILTPGPKLPALTDNRLLYRDGVPVATLSGGKVEFLTTLDSAGRWQAEKRLVRSAARGLLSQLS
jgi:ATP-dependent Lhr-like helicase